MPTAKTDANCKNVCQLAKTDANLQKRMPTFKKLASVFATTPQKLASVFVTFSQTDANFLKVGIRLGNPFGKNP
jgi:hypothetical protein